MFGMADPEILFDLNPSTQGGHYVRIQFGRESDLDDRRSSIRNPVDGSDRVDLIPRSEPRERGARR